MESQTLIIGPDSEYLVGPGKIVVNNLGVSRIEITVPGIIHLDCRGNELTELPIGLDLSIIESLHCENNKIKTFPGFPPGHRLIYLNCSNNDLLSIPDIPEGTVYHNASFRVFICSNNKLKKLPRLPESVIFIKCENNQITELSHISQHEMESLEHLNCANNKIKNLPMDITRIEILDVANNPLDPQKFANVLNHGVAEEMYMGNSNDDSDDPDNYARLAKVDDLTVSIDQIAAFVQKNNKDVYKYFHNFMTKMYETQITIVDMEDYSKMKSIDIYNKKLNVLLKKYNTDDGKRIHVEAPIFADKVNTLNNWKTTSKKAKDFVLSEKSLNPDAEKYTKEFLGIGGKKSRKSVNQKKKNTKKNRK
jgi:Leucine-rich repeat (LRR) protein